MKLWAMLCRATQDGGEFWQNVVHCRREWQTTSVFLPWENLMNIMKRQKDMTLKDELPRSVDAQYASGGKQRNSSRKNKEAEPKWKQWTVLVLTDDGSKVRCCKEQHCIGTQNVRSMNQDKLEVVKQEMERVNIHIWGITELKWKGLGDFNSDNHYIYYCEQESLRRNGVAIIVNKRVQKALLGCGLKNKKNDLCLFSRQTIQYHDNPSLRPNK